MKPIIGIIVCGMQDGYQFVSEPYIQAIVNSGGVPVLIPSPLLSPDTFYPIVSPAKGTHLYSDLSKNFKSFFADNCKAYYEKYVSFCSGFLFCGGGDITPCLLGEDPLDSSGQTDLLMDLFHLSLMEYILQQNKPLLGICRGMQVLNIALGGTIYQDLSLREVPSICHMQHALHRFDISHRVRLYNNSKLYNIFGDFEFTNSFHHQSVKDLGNELTAVGKTSDGVIEAIESSKHDFVVGVQWHPECMYCISNAARKLFFSFVNYH